MSETFIANELLALERLGLRVRVYSYRRPRAGVPHEFLSQIQAPVEYLPDPLNRRVGELLRAARETRRREPERFRRTFQYVLRHTLSERNVDTWRRFLQAGCLATLLAERDVQHLHAHFAHGATRVTMLASMLTGLPYSFTAHAHDIFTRSVNFHLLRDKVADARFVVTVSRHNKEYLAAKLGPVANGHVSVVYNGVDLERFSPDPTVARESDLVLGVGRFVEKKGFTHLVEAIRILRERGRPVRCELVGDGELQPRLVAQVRSAGLEDLITFTGTMPQERLPDCYRRASLLAMPAVEAGDGNRDALPTVLLEAMACGAPVVASRLGGIPEIVDDGESGLLVTPGDPTDLAAAIARLLDDDALRKGMGAAGRAKAERSFDLKSNARQLYELFAESREPAAV